MNEKNKEIIEENVKEVSLGEPTVKAVHNWRQRGPFVICDSCPTPHGFRIGNDKMMIGIENGMPKIKDRFK
jgi:hypothetical protein